ncbi:glycosyltransferase family 4 protein [Pinibacter soli]|uniref:Glycosyltransferase family 4 protein n=1 Tax=Pinibacter soli TaxID=3044211 RepID=A0ABT6R892_9BACT|nr:glycosyltransferase family 4 protein [Pinibacter soli]MDI3318621.1 glycosyltransferase family 4 protein [Pinibacter soli]
MNKKIILSHSGKQHSYYVARSLYRLGFLKKFYTSSYLKNPVLQKLASHTRFDLLSRRFIDGLPSNAVSSAWKYEVREQVARRLQATSQAVSQMVIDRDEKFDRRLSRKLVKLKGYDAFWGFQGSCLQSLKAAKQHNKLVICEMTIAHLPTAKRILSEEAKLQPEWADSFDFGHFPAPYEKRLIEEPLVADKVIAISSFLKKTLTDDGVDAAKVEVLPLGFDASKIQFVPETEKLSNRPLRVLYAGRITQRKGMKYLLDAFSQFDKKDVELHVIGNITGSGKAFWQHKGRFQYQQGVSQNALFQLYGKYDVLAFPSLLEGFGLVTVEAMGAGLPVITTPNTNATEVIRNEENGFLVPIRDADAIGKAITRVRNMDDFQFQQMRLSARNTALQYTWDSYENNLYQFLQQFFV